MKEAVEHSKRHELIDCGKDGKAYSTRNRKTRVFDRWVVPHWGSLELRAIKTVAVEQCARAIRIGLTGGRIITTLNWPKVWKVLGGESR
jgi:hypothetical protein